MVINTKTQLINNLDRVEGYLSSPSDELFYSMASYIARGRVFVAYIVDGIYHFAPSRFVGYKDNTLVKHNNNNEKDGKITNHAISKILGAKAFYPKLEDAYLKYCEWLGVTAVNHKRTYWLLNQDILVELTSEPFKEGGFKIRTHLVRERNSRVVKEAKRLFKLSHDGRLFCEICGFDFKEKYGKIGEGFIEAHHNVEFSKLNGVHEIKPSDFTMVCSNCHSMLHREGISYLKLKKRIKSSSRIK